MVSWGPITDPGRWRGRECGCCFLEAARARPAWGSGGHARFTVGGAVNCVTVPNPAEAGRLRLVRTSQYTYASPIRKPDRFPCGTSCARLRPPGRRGPAPKSAKQAGAVRPGCGPDQGGRPPPGLTVLRQDRMLAGAGNGADKGAAVLYTPPDGAPAFVPSTSDI
jgi:hypothetical protein